MKAGMTNAQQLEAAALLRRLDQKIGRQVRSKSGATVRLKACGHSACNCEDYAAIRRAKATGAKAPTARSGASSAASMGGTAKRRYASAWPEGQTMGESRLPPSSASLGRM